MERRRTAPDCGTVLFNVADLRFRVLDDQDVVPLKAIDIGLGVNIVPLVGHNPLRLSVMDGAA